MAELERMLASDSIDAPIAGLVERCARIPHCYTIQSCYGHFVCEDGTDVHRLKPILDDLVEDSYVHYRIAYMAFCLKWDASGQRFHDDLAAVTEVDPEYVQFGSADWFWNRCVNTYVLQVEPLRCVMEDSLDVGIREAIRIEAARDEFCSKLEVTIERHIQMLK